MRFHRLTPFLLVFAANASPAADSESDFSRREQAGKATEALPLTQTYLHNGIYRTLGVPMANAMKECLEAATASTLAFTFIADIAADGSFENVAVRPKTDTALCFAKEAGAFRALPPPAKAQLPLPIVIEMKVRP